MEIMPVFSGEIMGKTMNGWLSEAGEEVGKWLWQELPTWLIGSKVTPLEYEEIGGLEAVEDGLQRISFPALSLFSVEEKPTCTPVYLSLLTLLVLALARPRFVALEYS